MKILFLTVRCDASKDWSTVRRELLKWWCREATKSPSDPMPAQRCCPQCAFCSICTSLHNHSRRKHHDEY